MAYVKHWKENDKINAVEKTEAGDGRSGDF